jgi:hypothetical protein
MNIVMRKVTRLVALVGATVFGVITIAQIAVLVRIYIKTYRLPPPPFAIPGYRHFPIYRVTRDLRDVGDVGVIIFAFLCCMLYLRLVSSERQSSK